MPHMPRLIRKQRNDAEESSAATGKPSIRSVLISMCMLYHVARNLYSSSPSSLRKLSLATMSTSTTDDATGHVQQQEQEWLEHLIMPGNHFHILPPSSRIGPNGEPGYVHDPTFARRVPIPFHPSDAACLPPGEGFEQPQGYQSLQRIRNHLETSTAPRNVTVLCAIYTHAESLNAQVVRETWGQRCDGLLFASNETNLTTGHMHLPSMSQYGFQHKGMHQRVRTMTAYLYDNFLNSGYDYFHFSGDDTYLIVEHLKEFLASERVQQWESNNGTNYVSAGFWMHWGNKQNKGFMPKGTVYLGGGSGYTLSRRMLKAYVEGPLQTCSKAQVDEPNEDMLYAKCLQEKLPQPLLDTRDEAGAHRYHQVSVNWHTVYGGPRYDGTVSGTVIKESMKHMQRQFGFPVVDRDAYISNSTIAFHRHTADDLRRYEVLLYGKGSEICGSRFEAPSPTCAHGCLPQPLNETTTAPAAEQPINATAGDSISIGDNLWKQIQAQDSDSVRLIKFNQDVAKPPNGENLCVLARAFAGQSLALQALLLVMGTNTLATKEKDAAIQSISVFVANTHYKPSQSDDKELVQAIQKAVELLPAGSSVDVNYLLHGIYPTKKVFGYDVTNLMLKYTLENARCDRYLFTNGDNMYHSDLLGSINGHIRTVQDSDMIGFNFVSHHERNKVTNTVLEAKFEYGHIDLGAAVIQKRVITELCRQPINFHEGAANAWGGPWFAADWYFFSDALQCNATTSIIPRKVLFFHQ